MRVGFIGLGNMGRGMAARLLQAGHELVVYNRTPSKARPLIEAGARMATRISEAGGGDAVITMLADDAALEAVVFGQSGLLEGLAADTIHVSMSTISVALTQRLAAAHADSGRPFVSAPVFGRPEVAAAGKLFVLAAGEPGAVTACAPLFEAMGQRTLDLGHEPHVANLVKLSGNFLIGSVIEAVGEAMALVGKGGLGPRDYLEMLTSTFFDCPAYRTYGGLVADRRFKPAGFVAPLGLKDIRLVLEAAESLRVPMPLAGLLRDRFLRLLAQGGDDLDWSAIGRLPADDAGL